MINANDNLLLLIRLSIRQLHVLCIHDVHFKLFNKHSKVKYPLKTCFYCYAK